MVFQTLAIINQKALKTETVLWPYLYRWGDVIGALRILMPVVKGLSGAWEGYANLVDNCYWEDHCDDVEGDYAGMGLKFRLKGEKGDAVRHERSDCWYR